MASTVTDRIELAKLCSSKEWSKAIRILDSLLAQTCVIQDICNRAFCYSQLELHKHVIKDCDKALQLDPKLLQAYILKGRGASRCFGPSMPITYKLKTTISSFRSPRNRIIGMEVSFATSITDLTASRFTFRGRWLSSMLAGYKEGFDHIMSIVRSLSALSTFSLKGYFHGRNM